MLSGLVWYLYNRHQRRRCIGSAALADEVKIDPIESPEVNVEEVTGGEVHELPAKHGHSQLHGLGRIQELDRQEVVYELPSHRGG